MKKYLFWIVLVLASAMQGQIRIVNIASANADAPHSSAFIDASSNSATNATDNEGKGLLFPRTDLTKFTSFGGPTIGTPLSYPTLYDGMIVYNIANSGMAGVGLTEGGILTSGYWYYDNKSSTLTGGTWRPVSKVGLSNDWGLTGSTITATNFLGTLNAQPLRLVSNSTEIMRITPEGRVGIGTVSPTTKLQVNGQVRIVDGTQGAGKVFVSDANGIGTWTTLATTINDWTLTGNTIMDSHFLGTLNAQPLRLFTNNTEKMHITPQGRVGIGTTNPATTVQVRNIEAGAGGTTLQLTSPDGFSTELTSANAGNFLILLPSSAAYTVTRQGVFYDLVMNRNGNWAVGGYVNDAYKLQVYGNAAANGFFSTSDIRLKRNIKPVKNGLDIVNQLRPVSYEKKNNITNNVYNQSEIGFIAQEVRKVLPQIVIESQDEEKTLAMNYNSLIPILTKAIQELNDKITKLEKIIIKLEKQDTDLNKIAD
jgi:hypothetical protein